ncbi:MAG: class I SAM-dependent methyltransferase [Acidimicrobiales bacterium]
MDRALVGKRPRQWWAQAVTAPGIRRLNWGCGQRGEPGWINSDLKWGPGIDLTADIRCGLPIKGESMDYIVSVHALPMISYPDVVPALCELRRLLKPGGLLRLGLPDLDKGIAAYLRRDRSYFLVPDEDVSSIGGKFTVHMLWYGYSVTLFTADFAQELLEKAGFSSVNLSSYRSTSGPHVGIVELDNRQDESLFIEATK